MRKLIALLIIPFFLGTNFAYAQLSPPLPEDPIKEKILKATIKTALRLLITFKFTAILEKTEDEEISVQKSLAKATDDDQRLNFPISLPPKAIMDFKTAGIFDFKLNWHLKSRGLGTVTAAHIHCKNLLGGDGGIGVTLVPKGPFQDRWRKQHGTIKAPDVDNACEWKDMLDVFVALELNRAFVNIHTEENPEGEVSGDIENIGL